MTLRFQTRLILFCTVTFSVLLIVFGLASYRLLAQQLDVDATADLDASTAGLHSYLHFDNDVASIVFNENDPDQTAFVRKASRYYQVYDARDGRLIAESPDMALLGLRLTPGEVSQRLAAPATHDLQTAFGRYRVSSSSISPESGPRYLLQVAASLDPMDAALNRYLDLLLWRALPSLLATILVIWWMAHHALGPLSDMAAEARRVTIGSLDRRLETRGTGDQLDDLAVAFNETLASLEGAVADMRQFSSALAHELRTPLAAMRGELELALIKSRSIDEWRTGAASQIEEIDKLTRLVNQLLTLARAESGEIRLAREAVDLSTLAATVTEQLEPVAQSKNVTLACAATQPVTVTGDSQWLERLLINLLDNAIKYTPSGGDIRVSVSRENGRARLDVCDTGPGIPSEALPHLFERFYRVDLSRSSKTEGSGLGLSLAKWIVDRHHGRIDVRSAPGQGATFAVQLPAR
ncbi:MAG TPA: heavy metal sensor histidine kinase [Vicinamibacterales bacterium]|nr:heavy metal sensor histidine kinase [Vicinamibacterales bacterium]